MDPSDRQDLVFSSLRQIVATDTGFVIFTEPTSDQFIQFTTTGNPDQDDVDQILVDIPSETVNDNQPPAETLAEHFPDFAEWDSWEPGDYHKECTVAEAVNLVDIFFIQVSGLAESYDLEVEVDDNQASCFCCQSTVKHSDIDYRTLSVERAHELDIPENRIQAEVDALIDLYAHEYSLEGQYTEAELRAAAKNRFDEEPAILVPLCEDCTTEV